MPALSYFNGQMVTPPDYVGAAVPNGSSTNGYHHQFPLPPHGATSVPPPPPPPAYQYGGYAPPPPVGPGPMQSQGPPPYAAVKPEYQHQHAAAAGAYRRQPSRSQLFDHTSYSAHGTTFFLPQVPLDQAPPAPPQLVAPPPRIDQNYNTTTNPNASNSNNVTGGVSVKLDYSIDEMASFLSTMACNIMMQETPCPEFQKFCVQVLQATRLPKATIVLALVYLSKRWVLGSLPDTKQDNMAIYKMLVVALLLANKFHDDNTFTNKSWHQATGLPVKDLTLVEKQWLSLVQWSLHLNEQDLKGWTKWNDCWVMFTKEGSTNSGSATSSSSSSSSNATSTTTVTTPISSNSNSPDLEKYSRSSSSYTIPKWYEMANNRPMVNGPTTNGGNIAAGNNMTDFSYFQQSYALPPPPPLPHHQTALGKPQMPQQQTAAAVQPQSYYVSAYNNLATCNCSMCSFEPQKSAAAHGYHHHHHHHAAAPVHPVAFGPVGHVHPHPQQFPWFGAGVAAC